MSASDEAPKFLHIYLQDHAAGATAGAQRAERLADAESDSVDAAVLRTFAYDIEADRRALLTIIESVDVELSRWKSQLASVSERVGALKSNGRITTRSPLSTVVELEAMQMAVRGKRSLWETLLAVLPGPSPIDLDSLVARADGQLGVLSRLHAARVPAVFSVGAAESR